MELTEEDQVSYVALDNYHRVPFLESVKTNEAYQIASDMVDAEAMARCESKLEIFELERFLQTWLFFGLMQETLGENFHRRDFVDITRPKRSSRQRSSQQDSNNG